MPPVSHVTPLPSGAVPSQNGVLSARAAEFWFPECRDCTCCNGFKHGCKCCKSGKVECECVSKIITKPENVILEEDVKQTTTAEEVQASESTIDSVSSTKSPETTLDTAPILSTDLTNDSSVPPAIPSNLETTPVVVKPPPTYKSSSVVIEAPQDSPVSSKKNNSNQYNSAPNRAEHWYPENRYCGCCKGYIYGCNCCQQGASCYCVREKKKVCHHFRNGYCRHSDRCHYLHHT